jgi:hypothetical protein
MSRSPGAITVAAGLMTTRQPSGAITFGSATVVSFAPFWTLKAIVATSPEEIDVRAFCGAEMAIPFTCARAFAAVAIRATVANTRAGKRKIFVTREESRFPNYSLMNVLLQACHETQQAAR